jgi:osmotically-inducible protein OsmY
MFAKFATALLVAMISSTPAWAAQQRENLDVFQDVSQQVLRYPHFTIFDSVHAQVNDGIVTLTGKVTMPYKGTFL